MDDDLTTKIIIGVVILCVCFIIVIAPIYLLLTSLDALTSVFSRKERNIIETMQSENPIKLSYGKLKYNGPYPMPLDGKVTSDYGQRIHPITKKKTFHTGIDISGKGHSNILAIEEGRVISVNVNETYGNNITIRHIVYVEDEEGNERRVTFYTFYAHLSRVDVIAGQDVYKGNIIGIEGGDPENDPNPGLSTGHHLHFEVWDSNRKHINPNTYLFYD